MQKLRRLHELNKTVQLLIMYQVIITSVAAMKSKYGIRESVVKDKQAIHGFIYYITQTNKGGGTPFLSLLLAYQSFLLCMYHIRSQCVLCDCM